MKYRTKTRVVEAITFDELAEHGRRVAPESIFDGMPWSFEYKGHHISHENNNCYLIPTPLGIRKMVRSDLLTVDEQGWLGVVGTELFNAYYEPATEQRSGVELIAAERKRQIEVEGWSPEHDDEYRSGQLADAAGCYLTDAGLYRRHGRPPQLWPWAAEWWKPTPDNRVRELTKAGALAAAEIDRLQRKAARKDEP